MKRLKTSQNFFYFSRFVAVFTAIFLVMTVTILQTMKSNVYTTVDSDLKSAISNINDHVDFRMRMLDSSQTKPKFKPEQGDPNRELDSSVIFMIFNSSGEILNSTEFVSDLAESYVLDTSNLGEIQQEAILNVFDQKEVYRYITCRVSDLNYPEVSYATVLVNVTRIEQLHGTYVRRVVILMSIFWLLSVIASTHLSKLAQRPLLKSYEKQKDFVENASHELRTPLAVLQNRLEGLFRHPDTTILDNSESIAASLEEVRNMKLLTTNLLNLARRDEGLEPQLEELENTFFDDLFENYQLIAEENDKIFTGVNLTNQTFTSDKTLLKQLMTILFDNAVKYTDDDGVIKVSVYQKDKHLYIEVADNGPGIPDADKPKIFDRFYRVDKARTRQKGGFGLGLALAKQIVTSLKGQISLEDNQPQGTVFKVVL